MRGRTRNKGPNPLTRSYESNGPDVKIRGTAQHIADKYAQLARDATASGDPVAAENYHQHAEHYYRLIAAAQEAYRQQFGTPQRGFDDELEEGDEDGAPQGAGYGYGDRQGGGPGLAADEFGDGFGQGFEPPRGGGERQGGGRFESDGRPDRGDRGQNDRPRFDRNGGGQDRGQRFDRNNGQDRNQRFDRNNGGGQDRGQRFDRNGERAPGGDDRFDRNGERFDRPMNGSGPQGGERYGQGGGYDRQDRQDGRDRNGRDGNRGGEGRRDFGRDRQPRGNEGQRFGAPVEDAPEPVAGNLPAFLTNPVRAPITMGEGEQSEPIVAPTPMGADEGGEFGAAVNGGAPEGRSRRAPRRSRRPEGESLDFGAGPDAGDKPAE